MDTPYIKVEKMLKDAGISEDERFQFLSCCEEYYRSFLLLKQYDEYGEESENTASSTREHQTKYLLQVRKVESIIEALKLYFAERGENVTNFAVPNNGGIEQIIGNIYQTWDQKEFYPSLEDKAAQLFYLLVKDHVFLDGNKRIASFLFLWFLDMNDMLVTGKEDRTFNYLTLYALAIFVADSNPRDKDTIVEFIRTLITTYRRSLPDILF